MSTSRIMSFTKMMSFSLLLSVTTSISADTNKDQTDQSTIDKLNELLSQTTTVKAKFKQLMVDNQSNSIQEAEGEVLAKRPGSFRWQTNAPFQQLTITDGATLWLYDQDLEQVTIYDVNEQMKNTPAALLSGEIDSLAENFIITGSAKEQDKWVFEMTPKVDSELFDNLTLSFDQGKISQMVVQDRLGQLTSFQFTEIETNLSVEDTTFSFTPPAGVDVITQSDLPSP